MTEFTLQLGVKVKEKITGFQGIVTGRVQYLFGCNQYLVIPKVKKDGSVDNGQWYDEGRLEQTSKDIVVQEQTVQAKEKGCDIAPPIR